MALLKVNWLNGAVLNDTTASETVAGLTNFTFQGRASGSPASWGVLIEGSIDGTNWETLTSIGQNAQFGAYRSDYMFGNSTPDSVSNGRFVQYLRLRVTSLSGGTSPTVSVSMLAL